jgi:hypothetical protein
MMDLVWDGMTELQERLKKYAPTTYPVLLLGENGTGKSEIAEWIHRQSGRSTAPFVSRNCANFPENLFETELFGSKKGAFTGAVDQEGAFLMADGGTLFLDELGEIPLSLQAKLLTAIETGEIRRVGQGAARKVDVRLICATNQPLLDRVNSKAFREDLYHRIAVLPMTILPVRERTDCIRPIFRRLLQQAFMAASRDTCPRISEELWRVLEGRPWMGNIREMKNLAVRLSIEAAGKLELTPSDLDQVDFERVRSPDAVPTGAEVLEAAPDATDGGSSDFRPHVNAICAAAGISDPDSKDLVDDLAARLAVELACHAPDAPESATARKVLFRDLTVAEDWPLQRLMAAALAVVLRWDCGRRGVPMSLSLFASEYSKSFGKAPAYTAVIKPIVAWLDLRAAPHRTGRPGVSRPARGHATR